MIQSDAAFTIDESSLPPTPHGLTTWVEPAAPSPASSPRDIIREALANPIGGVPLRMMAQGKRTAAILVPGKDRIAGVETLLPLLLGELNDAGIPDDGITVTVARGTHAHHSEADIRNILGPEASGRVRWKLHQPDEGEHLRHVGTTRRGTPVALDREVLDSDVKILTGRIIPHYFAGFGGGRKALVPGVASRATILANHRLTLAPESGIHPAIRPCSLRENPVHLDMLEAAQFVPSTFVVNTLLDHAHRLTAAVAGGLEAAHAAGCRLAMRQHVAELPGPVDAAIACAGGWPYDCDFVQALKALFDVQEIVRPGGAILWIAQCPLGMKEGFLRWAAIRSDDELNARIRERYDLAGHNTLLLRRLLGRARVALWSDLPAEPVRTLGIQPVHSLREGLDWLADACPRNYRCAAVPHANITFATLHKDGTP